MYEKFYHMTHTPFSRKVPPELWEDKLRLKRYDAVRQRIDINCVLPHLDRAETEKYIQSQ